MLLGKVGRDGALGKIRIGRMEGLDENDSDDDERWKME